jgi:integrase
LAVFKKYKSKRVGPKHKDYAKGTWYLWKRVEGRIIHKALKTAQNKEEAEHAEREIIRAVFNKKYGIASKETVREFVDRVYRKYVAQNNVSLATKDLYIRLLCDVWGKRFLVDITPQDCRNAQNDFRKRYSASTTNQLMSTASKIFNLAGEEGILDKNPMAFVKRLKEPPARDRLLSKEEWERLWKELEKDEMMMRLVTLAVNLPLRRGQLLSIAPTDCDLNSSVLTAKASKGRASRTIPLNDIARQTLNLMMEDSQLPFPLKETGLRKRWMRITKRARIENMRFHDLRRCMATELNKQGVPGETIRKLYGHSAMKITQVYISPEMAEMAEAVRTLDNVQEVENVQ